MASHCDVHVDVMGGRQHGRAAPAVGGMCEHSDKTIYLQPLPQ